jgi:hypothetical protein
MSDALICLVRPQFTNPTVSTIDQSMEKHYHTSELWPEYYGSRIKRSLYMGAHTKKAIFLFCCRSVTYYALLLAC